MSDRERLLGFVETWKGACADFVALARTIPEDQAHLPTDLPGWDVADNVAHTAHLEAVLAGAPEETIAVSESPHIKSLTGAYTEQGVIARRERNLSDLCDEIERSAEIRYAELRADPPEDGSAPAPRTPSGVPWNNQTLLSNRPLDVWMHEQDIRRAINRPGGYDTAAATHTMKVLGASLPMVLGKRVGAPAGTSVLVNVPDAGLAFGARVGADGRAERVIPEAPTATITLSPEDFIVLVGGRRTPDAVDAAVEGDTTLAQAVMAAMAVTP